MKRTPLKRKTKLRKTSKAPLSRIKKKAWNEFSTYIRQKGMDSEGLNECITCLQVLPWKKLQAGHLIDGRNNAILFDERGVYPQCLPCNVFKHGNKIDYLKSLERKFGREGAYELIDELHALSKSTKKYSYQDYEIIYMKYKEINSNAGLTHR